MTKNQFRKKVKELLKENNKKILNSADIILMSGCLDLDSVKGDSYGYAKSFMCAVSKKMAHQWRPLTDEYRNISENMEKFI